MASVYWTTIGSLVHYARHQQRREELKGCSRHPRSRARGARRAKGKKLDRMPGKLDSERNGS